jgi:hypothetical protein
MANFVQDQPDLKPSRSGQLAPSHPLDPLTGDEVRISLINLNVII